MKCIQEGCLIVVDVPFDVTQIVRRDAAIVGERNRIKPELALTVIGPDMNVRGFMPSSE